MEFDVIKENSNIESVSNEKKGEERKKIKTSLSLHNLE